MENPCVVGALYVSVDVNAGASNVITDVAVPATELTVTKVAGTFSLLETPALFK